MIGFKNLVFIFAMMSITTACQKARMTSVKPQGPVYTYQPAPTQPTPPIHTTPVPQQPIDVQPYPDQPETPIVVGPDPILEPYQPSPSTPIEDDVRPLDPDIFSPHQQGGVRPEIEGANVVEWFENPVVDSVLSQCGEECPPVVVPPPPPKPVAPQREYCAPIQLDTKPVTQKLDILFVVDTSASLKDERSQIAAQMGAFIDRLERNVDYQIAVMPAHGPATDKSPNNFHGELALSHGDPAVIKYNRNQNKSVVIEALKKKMASLETDRSSAQGEVGLLGLYRSVTNKYLREALAYYGFMRSDAALAVIFVADEQDVCYDYKRGGTPNFDGSGKRDPVEQKTFDTICKHDGKNQLSPELVHQALLKVKGKMPLILTGVLYTSENIPQRTDKYAKENEMGRGYLDLIDMGSGQAVSLADKNFGASLAKLGNFSKFKMEYPHEFICKTSVDPLSINRDSFRASVSTAGGQNIGKAQIDRVRVLTDARKNPAYVLVTLDYEQFQKIAKPGAKIQMSFQRNK